MQLFGLTITRTKAHTGQLSSVDSSRGWWPIIRESYAGSWQNNVDVSVSNVSSSSAVFTCSTLIASDIAKMRLRLVQQDQSGVWSEADNPAFSPVLRKPNHYQNRIRFIETWVLSKLLHGNTYVLKARDNRGVVVGLYILDPQRARPLVAPNGDVYYELKKDDLSRLPEDGVVVPANEIIHDLHNAIFHPLVGLSAIFASGLAAIQGLNIQNNSTQFFGHGSNPGGVLTAPGSIGQATADRLKAYWDQNFTGDNVGKIAVLGDGLKYEAMTMTATDSQLIEQLKWTSETICSTFHVPPYMVGVGPPPSYHNIEALNQQYYAQCLQTLIESIELSLDEGLGLTTGDVASRRYGTEFDLDDLLRMDSSTMMKTIGEGVNKGIMAPNEGRAKLNLGPVTGGESPYIQQQNFSLEALSVRDENQPFARAPSPAPAPSPSVDDEVTDRETRAITARVRKALAA